MTLIKTGQTEVWQKQLIVAQPLLNCLRCVAYSTDLSQVTSATSYLEPLKSGAVACASRTHNSKLQMALLDQSKTVVESMQNLLIAAKEAGGNSKVMSKRKCGGKYCTIVVSCIYALYALRWRWWVILRRIQMDDIIYRQACWMVAVMTALLWWIVWEFYFVFVLLCCAVPYIVVLLFRQLTLMRLLTKRQMEPERCCRNWSRHLRTWPLHPALFLSLSTILPRQSLRSFVIFCYRLKCRCVDKHSQEFLKILSDKDFCIFLYLEFWAFWCCFTEFWTWLNFDFQLFFLV